MCRLISADNQIRTKHLTDLMGSYLDCMAERLRSKDFYGSIYTAVKNLPQMTIPGIVINNDVLKADDDQAIKRILPSLFV